MRHNLLKNAERLQVAICTVMLLFICGLGQMWGYETYTYDFTAGAGAGKNILTDINTEDDIVWTASSLTNVGNFVDAYKGFQVGTSSATGSITLTSKNWGAEPGTFHCLNKIRKVYVWLNNGSGTISASVTINGYSATSSGSVSKNSSASSQRDGTSKVTYTPASGHDMGVIVITCSTSSKAGYVCAIQVECEAAASTYNVNWNVGDDAESESGVTCGTPPDVSDGDLGGSCSSLAFVGWSVSNLGSTSGQSAPVDLFSSDNVAPLSGNKTFYAVFAEATGSVGAVMYSENFGGYSNTDIPSGSVSSSTGNRVVYGGGSVTYTCTNGDGTSPGTTNVTTADDGILAGGTSPELLIGKKGTGGTTGGSFSIAGIPKGGATELTLTFKKNNNVDVSVSGTGYSITKEPGIGLGDNEYTITCGSATTFTLTFTVSIAKNIRLDDICVAVKTVSYSNYVTACSTPIYSITLDKNGGSANGSAKVIDDATSLTNISAPTRAGYHIEGYYTNSACTTKVATAAGALQPSITVGGNDWTNSSSEWVRGAGETFYTKWLTYGDYKFSCAELTLTGPSNDTVFITSAASQKVRSIEAFHISGSGLTPGATVTFSFGNDALNEVFSFKKADGTALTVSDPGGTVDEDIYVFYTPASGSTTDGLETATNLTASVGGAKPKTTILNTKTIIGRHLPTNFVIAAKRNSKWYALPSNMTTGTPSPEEIAVNDADNPSMAYTTTSNMYTLYGQHADQVSSGDGQYVKLAMQGQSNAPLFGSASTAPIGKSDGTIVTNSFTAGYWWKLARTRADVTNPQDAKYIIYCANNSTNHLRLKENAGNPIWGLYDAGVEELRLIPASSATVVEAYFIEYGTAGGVIEVDADAISATKVKAIFNGHTSNKIALSKMQTSGGKTSTYNYIVTFDNDVNFTANDAVGKILMLEWYNSNDEMVGVTSIEMPKIIAANTTMSSIESNKTPWSKWEVHILPGYRLEANLGSFSSGGAIRELHIYPGATLKVTTASIARTMTIDTLILRNGWSRAGSKRYDVARLYIQPYKSASENASNLVVTNAYADWYIDYDQYYSIAVPWDVTVANIKYRYCSVSPSVGYENNIRLRYYDGAGRAAGTNSGSSNWKDYGKSGNTDVPTTLKPSQGYVMSAKRPSGKAFSILRMPLSIPSASWTAAGEQGEVSSVHKNQVSVTAHGVGGSAPWYAQGWNFIANPYMACFNGDDSGITGKLLKQEGGSVKFATIPSADFKDYTQEDITDVDGGLKPSSGFLVQVETTGTLEFSNSKIIAPSAPARYTNEAKAVPEQEAYIRLSYEGGKDQMGLIIGADYTADYEINADLSKMLGEANTVKTYMQYGGTEMAYVAINEQLAREWIPVIVKIPAEGEYTYSLRNSSTVDNLEGLYLIDYQTGVTTNLLFDDYTFTATETGTVNGRFAINAIVGNHKVPTSADITGLDTHSNEPIKFIWHDQVYILHGNVIYDSTGKRVNVINK